jgi:transaldolase
MMNLRWYLDTADTTAWAEWLPSGLFYGVTTNPTLLQRANQPCSIEHLSQLAQRAFELGAGEIQVQAWGETAEALYRCGSQLATQDRRVVVKLPITRAGCAAGRQLIQAGKRVTMTAVYRAPQALIAAALGAECAAPYLGRISDGGRDGRAEIIAMQRSLDGVGSPLRLLVASIREIDDLAVLAAAGLNTFTFSPAIARSLFDISDTLTAAAAFEAAVHSTQSNAAQ